MYKTIRETARLENCPLTEGRLRALVKQGRVPGFRVGNRFYIHTGALFEMYERISVEAVEAESRSTVKRD